jgi:hypothetical protein
MKHFQLIGGFIGFVLAAASSLWAGNEIAIALRDGSVGCIAGAIMMRMFHHVVAWSVRDLAAERARIAAKQKPEGAV